MKKIEKSIYIYDSLINNGLTLIPIIASLFNFYFNLLKTYSSTYDLSKSKLNKTMQSKMHIFRNNFTFQEISNIIIDLRNIDIITKSSSIDSKLLFYPFIIKVCKGYHAEK